MKKLTVFNQEIIPVYVTNSGEKVVMGRELHEKLSIGKDYTTWIKDMCAYGFQDGTDYSPISVDRSDGLPGKPRTDHLLKFDMAKHIAMIQRTPEGKAIRDKLIALETNVSELSPELRLLINMEIMQKRQEEALEDMGRRLEDTCDLIALNPNSWRNDTRGLIVKIARRLGGVEYIREAQAEIFKLVDQRAGVSLETRLTNKRRRMADEGVSKSRRDRLNKVDVIAEDKKLIEIYMAVVKEYAIKNGVTAEKKGA